MAQYTGMNARGANAKPEVTFIMAATSLVVKCGRSKVDK